MTERASAGGRGGCTISEKARPSTSTSSRKSRVVASRSSTSPRRPLFASVSASSLVRPDSVAATPATPGRPKGAGPRGPRHSIGHCSGARRAPVIVARGTVAATSSKVTQPERSRTSPRSQTAPRLRAPGVSSSMQSQSSQNDVGTSQVTGRDITRVGRPAVGLPPETLPLPLCMTAVLAPPPTLSTTLSAAALLRHDLSPPKAPEDGCDGGDCASAAGCSAIADAALEKSKHLLDRLSQLGLEESLCGSIATRSICRAARASGEKESFSDSDCSASPSPPHSEAGVNAAMRPPLVVDSELVDEVHRLRNRVSELETLIKSCGGRHRSSRRSDVLSSDASTGLRSSQRSSRSSSPPWTRTGSSSGSSVCGVATLEQLKELREALKVGLSHATLAHAGRVELPLTNVTTSVPMTWRQTLESQPLYLGGSLRAPLRTYPNPFDSLAASCTSVSSISSVRQRVISNPASVSCSTSPVRRRGYCGAVQQPPGSPLLRTLVAPAVVRHTVVVTRVPAPGSPILMASPRRVQSRGAVVHHHGDVVASCVPSWPTARLR